MKQIIFESSPAFIFVCAAIGLGYAWLLYRSKNPWNTTLNKVLFALRAALTFLLTFFLLGPIVKQVQNQYEKPLFFFLQDNSVSVRETMDSLRRGTLVQNLESARSAMQEKGYEAVVLNFTGEGTDSSFTNTTSNLHEALRSIDNRYEGRSIGGVVLVSDGIYTTGMSPLFGNYSYPVYSVGVGDTTVRPDLMIRNLIYNKIAYQGNKFPLRVEVSAKGFSQDRATVSLLHKGKLVDQKIESIPTDGLMQLEFQPLASEQGIQRWDVVVEEKSGEQNLKNNRTSVFIEVVEGRKKILLIASSPHPDIKALRSVIEQNNNFEFFLHIPGVEETDPKNLQPDAIDLAILHQVPDMRGRTRNLFQRLALSRISLFIVLGNNSDLNQIIQQKMPLAFEQLPRQWDEVTPVINTAFSHFTLSTEANSAFSGFPPVQVPFGKIQVPVNVSPLLMQRVGSLTTDKPLLYIQQDDVRKTAMMMGEGLWRWRLHEFSRTEKTEAFDEVFGKLFQYLTTTDDKRKFRSYPVQQQFSETEPIMFESQVYNDIYEPVYGNTIKLELTSEQGERSQYSYTLSPGNSRYPIGGLKEGVYRYSASTELNGKVESVGGQFLVVAQQLELQNLTADFDLLRKLSRQTGGAFYPVAKWSQLSDDLNQLQARSVIRSTERYDALISLKWIFFLLVLLIGAEWFLRKYFGSY